VCCCLAFETPKPRIPKSRNVSSTPFHLSQFGSCCTLDVWLWNSFLFREVPNPEILKYGSHLSFLSHFGSLFMLMFGHRNSRSSEPRNPEMRDPPFLFRIFESLFMLIFGHWNSRSSEPRNPEIRVSPFFSFAFRKFVHVDVWTPELAKFRTPKSRNAGPTFPFSHFRKFVYVDVWTLELTKFRTPKKCESYLSLFRIFRSCCVLLFGTCTREIPKKSRSTGHLSQFRELLCVLMFGFCTRETPNPEIPKCWPTVFPYFRFRQTVGSFVLFGICDHRNPIDLCFFTKL
jgi:hypothetical protein